METYGQHGDFWIGIGLAIIGIIIGWMAYKEAAKAFAEAAKAKDAATAVKDAAVKAGKTVIYLQCKLVIYQIRRLKIFL